MKSAIPSSMLPAGFVLPKDYLSFDASFGRVRDPWHLFQERDADRCISFAGRLAKIFVGQTVPVPFAWYKDMVSDSHVIIAFFDGDDCSGHPAIAEHDMGQSRTGIDWDKRRKLSSFSEWIKSAEQDSIKYEKRLAEWQREMQRDS